MSGCTEAPPPCPLCNSGGGREWRDEHGVPYYFCPSCDLIHLHPEYRPSLDSERRRYLEHNNSPDEPGYVAYLTGFAEHTIFPYLPAGTRILDFGSGPAPVLSTILNRRGYRAQPYDPFFAPDGDLSPGSYDGVAAVEVAEHLFKPAEEFDRMRSLLRPGGFLFLRTELHDGSPEFFSSWWYRRDRTHIVFYSRKTISYIAATLRLRLAACTRGREIVLAS